MRTPLPEVPFGWVHYVNLVHHDNYRWYHLKTGHVCYEPDDPRDPNNMSALKVHKLTMLGFVPRYGYPGMLKLPQGV